MSTYLEMLNVNELSPVYAYKAVSTDTSNYRQYVTYHDEYMI